MVAAGQVLARYGDAPQVISKANLDDQPQSIQETNFVHTADLHLQAPALQPQGTSVDRIAYTVSGGETLQSIARNLLGDARQWWRIAEANALAVAPDSELAVGLTLQVPKLGLNANSADTFAPYDPRQHGPYAAHASQWGQVRGDYPFLFAMLKSYLNNNKYYTKIGLMEVFHVANVA